MRMALRALVKTSLFLVPLLSCRTSTTRTTAQATVHGNEGRASDPIAWVDPFIGTDDGDSPDPPPGDKGGSVFPGATVPFGMIQWSPDTAPEAEFSYHHRDQRIRGFTVNHISGPGCPALLDFPFLPTSRSLTTSPAGMKNDLQLAFSHANEQASPGKYSVRTNDGITVELTARPRAGFARLTYPKHGEHALLLEAGKTAGTVLAGQLHVVSSNRVTGSITSQGFCGGTSTYKVHLAAHFDQEIVESSAYGKDVWKPGSKDVEGANNGLLLRFSDKNAAPLKIAVAISYVSVDNAIANLEQSMAGAAFDQVAAEAESTWRQHLGRIQVEGGSPLDKRMFYTALYHTLLHPNVFSDVNGQFMGFDGQVHTAEGYTQYANFSGWDIYRSWIQLIAWIAPEQGKDILRSLVVTGQQCGGLPRWTLANDETGVMVGDPGALIIANGHAFGLRGFGEQDALALMKQGSEGDRVRCNKQAVRPGQALYRQLGYLPMGAKEAGWGPASTTLEYAAADYAIAQFARALGDEATASVHLERSRNWKNVFNPATGYVQPRAADGTWQSDFNPNKYDFYVEGNAAQYTFFVPHDPKGLIAALGGADATVKRLDALFTQLNSGLSQPYFYIGNEPQFGTPWLYNYAGQPWKTQEIIDRIITRTFSDKPGGLPGNDDLGATSSWFVWANLGLYPDLPGTGSVSLNTPRFSRATVARPKQGTLTILTSGAGRYINSVALNGKAIEGASLGTNELVGQGTLGFEVQGQPNRGWGVSTQRASTSR